MRIISGIWKGRRILPPHHLPVRPTTDFAKEGLFNVLTNLIDFTETRVIDLFAGTGNISFEFASRGCPGVLAVDIERRCTDFINLTARDLGMNMLHARRMNVKVFLRQYPPPCDLVFADPPYEMAGIPELVQQVLQAGMIVPGGLFVLEHSEKFDFQAEPLFFQLRKYGKVHFSLFKQPEAETAIQYSSS